MIADVGDGSVLVTRVPGEAVAVAVAHAAPAAGAPHHCGQPSCLLSYASVVFQVNVDAS